MTSNVIRIRSDGFLHEAQKLLIESKLTRLVVIDRYGKLRGIITRRDLVRFLIRDKSGRPLDEIYVRQVMSAPVVTLQPTDTLAEAARVMNKKGISSIVVTDHGNEVLGIVTKTDLCFHFSLFASKEKVKDFMTRKVFTVRPTHSIFFASSVLARQGISRVIVVDGRLRGIITLSDIVKRAPVMRPEIAQPAERGKTRRALLAPMAKLTAMTASEVMTQHPLTVMPEAALSSAAELLIEHGISGLPVVDSKNRLRGIVTKTDIVRAIAA
jgi:CBS domain-containing protein